MLRQLPFYFCLTLTILLSKEVLSQHRPLKAVEVRTSSSIFGKRFYRVYHFGDLILYESQYEFDSSEVHFKVDSPEQDTIPSESTLLLSEMRNKFFVFHRDRSYGYSYDPHSPIENGKRLCVDSTLKLIQGWDHFESVISSEPDSSSWLQNHSVLREVYRCAETDSTPSITLILEYSKNLDSVKESLNPAVDNMKRMKLFKFQFASNKFYDKRTNKEWPAMEMLGVEMEEVPVNNTDEVMHYFEQYKRDTNN